MLSSLQSYHTFVNRLQSLISAQKWCMLWMATRRGGRQTMQPEDYFDFLAPDDIRIKGHRIGIETVLYEFIHRERCAEEIQRRYPTLTLEEVYATILYYLHNQE